MKLTGYFALALTALAMGACSDSDNPVSLSDEIKGTYSGYCEASCRYFTGNVAPSQTVTVTPVDNTTAAISYISDSFGTFTINEARLTRDDKTVVASGSGSTLMGMGDKQTTYDCTFTGVWENGVASMTFSVPAVMGGLTIQFEQGDVPASLVLPGEYEGYTDASSAYFKNMMAGDQTLVISSPAQDTYNVSFTSETWGVFSVADIKVTLSDNVFSLTGNGKCQMGMNGNIKEYECSLTGSVDVAKENPQFRFSVPAVMGGMTIEFRTGDMPQTES